MPDISDVVSVDVGNNLSDHMPLTASITLKINTNTSSGSNNGPSCNTSCHLRWDKADRHVYDALTFYNLESIGLGFANLFSDCDVGCKCGRL